MRALAKFNLKNSIITNAFSKRLTMRFFSQAQGSGTSNDSSDQQEKVSFIFKYLSDGTEVPVTSSVGDSILKAAHDNKIDIEGACDSSLSCSTCHVILDDDIFESIPHAEETEDDLLDLAYGLTHTSRLGCQVLLTKQFDGKVIKIPAESNNQSAEDNTTSSKI